MADRDPLSDDNLDELLNAPSFASSREVEALIAEVHQHRRHCITTDPRACIPMQAPSTS